MSEFVKIKQVENLASELAKIALVEQLAIDAGTLAAEAKSGLDGLSQGSARVKQTFKSLVATANTKVNLQLSKPITNDQDIQLFINGVLVFKITATVGSDQVEFTVPYPIDATDTVVIFYSI